MAQEQRVREDADAEKGHRADEKTFKDFTGDTIPLIDRKSG
jgi:hypothetical protein